MIEIEKASLAIVESISFPITLDSDVQVPCRLQMGKIISYNMGKSLDHSCASPSHALEKGRFLSGAVHSNPFERILNFDTTPETW